MASREQHGWRSAVNVPAQDIIEAVLCRSIPDEGPQRKLLPLAHCTTGEWLGNFAREQLRGCVELVTRGEDRHLARGGNRGHRFVPDHRIGILAELVGCFEP